MASGRSANITATKRRSIEKPRQYEPFFIHRAPGIVRDPAERIAEDRRRFLE